MDVLRPGLEMSAAGRTSVDDAASKTGLKPYARPLVKSEAIFERTALLCTGKMDESVQCQMAAFS